MADGCLRRRASAASEPRERSAPAPFDFAQGAVSGSRTAKRRAPAFAPQGLRRGLAVALAEAEESVSGSPRGEAPRKRLIAEEEDQVHARPLDAALREAVRRAARLRREVRVEAQELRQLVLQHELRE